jgi:beta-N-acetylhexosaminidase
LIVEHSSTELLARLSLRQKLGQLFLMSFVGWHGVSPVVRSLNEKGLLGGIIFFSGSNVQNIDQLRLLTSLIQGMARESPIGIPYLITLDQEGGQLTALHRGATIFPGQMALGRAGDTALTARSAHQTGQELRWAGITTNFAPVLDTSADSLVSGVHVPDNRMISSDPREVAVHGVELVRGLQAEGVMACAKHYPGMRPAERDTHHQADIVDYPIETLERSFLLPFRAAVDAGVASVMTHHGIYRAFDDLPASLSPGAIGFLRHDLGFKGLVITDDLVMKAIQDDYPGVTACEMALNAGADLIILTGAGESLLADLEDSVRAGRVKESVVDTAVLRVLEAKSRYVTPAASASPPDRRGWQLSLEISRRAVAVHSNEGGLVPLRHVVPATRVSVILANPARLVMSDTVNFYDISLRSVLERAGVKALIKEAFMPWNPTDEESLSLFDIGFTSDIVVFTTVNAYRFTRQLEVLKQIHGLRRGGGPSPRVIAVATRSPDDVPLLLPLADAVLSTAGITPAQMRAVAEAIFGRENLLAADEGT